MQTLRRIFLQGLFVVVPIALAYWVLESVYSFVDHLLGEPINDFLSDNNNFYIPGIGFILMIALVGAVGIALQVGMGRWLVEGLQELFLRIPIIRTVYSPARQLFDGFTARSNTGFKRVVIVEHPQPGTWTFGFLTAAVTVDDNEFGIVYVATSPMPNSGWFAAWPIDKIHDVDMAVGDAMNLIFSGGIRAPSQVRRSALAADAVAEAPDE